MAAEEDWSCVLTTSKGQVIVDEIVPATPPESRLNIWLFASRVGGCFEEDLAIVNVAV
tara:strand:+ start:670 stop:843 length:174 start_codon:yes stop_codon:yes gene_type:complete